ncbi:hypothetical protein NQ314_004967 [Rhamnusium bicolor]|uniref:DDE Tnp4 domain-containing protein n=1 Tax=Rhamnusium bicolor TaxID=1586634 RepID=A0AAV8ZIM0_9CUCU|nr:hypothetical protein NQ314_004967 [Rhamnusium bicolor]
MDLNFILLIRAIGNEEERREHRIIKRQLRDHSNPLTLPEVIFKQIYRLCRTIAHYLVQEISPFLQEKEREEIAIPDTLIVLCALHFYGQGSYQNKSVDAVTSILNEHFGHIQFPISEEEKDIEKWKFMNMGNGFPGILFYNRKEFYSINVQCIVGADLKLLALNARYIGSVHDSAIWATSAIRMLLLEEYQIGHRNSWLIGDGGYPLEPWLLTPVSGPNINDHEQKFNRAHRSTRNVAERFNGVFKAIFTCCSADRTLHYAPEKASKIINACGIIYNIYLNRHDFEEVEETNDDIENQNDEPLNPEWQNGPLNQEWRNEGNRVKSKNS